MKTIRRNTQLFRLDLAGLILMILLLQVIFAMAQSGLDKGKEMFKNGNYYGAERFFTQVTNEDEQNAYAWYYLGRMALEKEEMDKADEFLNRATDLEPENSEFLTWKGIYNIRMLSRVDFMKQAFYAPKALKSLEKAVELDPKNIEARIYLAGYYANAPSFAGGSMEKADDQFKAIFNIDPTHKGALLQHGVIKMQSEEYELARTSFEKIMKLDPEYFPAYYHMGRLSAESHRFVEQGELSLRKFIDLAPEEFKSSIDEAWWQLGKIYANQGKNEKAKEAYEKALALDPENEEYRKSLKNIL